MLINTRFSAFSFEVTREIFPFAKCKSSEKQNFRTDEICRCIVATSKSERNVRSERRCDTNTDGNGITRGHTRHEVIREQCTSDFRRGGPFNARNSVALNCTVS